LGIPVAGAAHFPVTAGAGVDLAVVPVTTLPILPSAAAVLRVRDLVQVARLDAVRYAAKVVDIESGVVIADEDGESRDMCPCSAGKLLIYAPPVAVPTNDQATIAQADRAVQQVCPESFISEVSGQSLYLRQHCMNVELVRPWGTSVQRLSVRTITVG
jgi:hypothetical protein